MADQGLIQENVPLSPLTTLRIGGPARFFAEARGEEEMLAAFSFAEQRNLPLFILGGGSNALVADEGFPGLVVHVALKGVTWRDEGDEVVVTAQAGEDWDELVRQCVERDLAGVECLSGIPGSVGGAPIQNVGAYGQDVSETITSVRAFDRLAGGFIELSNEQCQFGYRASVFNTTVRGRYVVTAVAYALKPHGEPAIRYPDLKNFFSNVLTSPSLGLTREVVRGIRAQKAMLITPDDPDCRSAGSFFKNPVIASGAFARIKEIARERNLIGAAEQVPNFPAGDGKIKVPAAWLIERAGFHKGYNRGAVGISSKHTLAIVNRGGATAREVIGLMKEIQDRVAEKFAVPLTPEPVFVGFDNGNFDGPMVICPQ
ncbi:MAG TPA: UDP-N-acetylmuramate dehydrogenase [Blastocatellia bacterium]|nr:UDP-N-acetylmuramate dehydrogenase [Blastocatellia bacterium]